MGYLEIAPKFRPSVLVLVLVHVHTSGKITNVSVASLLTSSCRALHPLWLVGWWLLFYRLTLITPYKSASLSRRHPV